MSIEKDFGKFYAVCDVCGETLPPEYEYSEAIEAMAAEGWTSKRVAGGWHNVCPDCQRH